MSGRARRVLLAMAMSLVWSPLAARTPFIVQGDEPVEEGRAHKYWEEEGVSETVVDEAGEIYRSRPYQGVVPNVRDAIVDKKTSKVHQRGPVLVTWVGFQQMALFSRIFVQTNRMAPYTLFKRDPLHIVVEFPSARIGARLLLRSIPTREFNSRVAQIDAKRTKGGGVQVVITLKEPTGYLYKQEGQYVFVDVER